MRLTRAVSLVDGDPSRGHVVAGPRIALAGDARRRRQTRPLKPKHDLVARGGGDRQHQPLRRLRRVDHLPKVFLFRKIGNGSFVLYRKIKTNNKGKFRTRIFQYRNLRTCFKVGAPETAALPS